MKTFASLPPSLTIAEGVLAEKQYMARWMIDRLKKAEKERPGSWRELWDAALAGTELSEPLKEIDTFEEATKLMERIMPVYDELARIVDLPQAEFDARYPDFEKEARAATPVSDILLPAVRNILNSRGRSRAKMEMLLAGIAVVDGGPEKLAGIKDPFGDGPFGFRELENGAFELSSKLTLEGKPVTLTIGKKPAQ